MRAAMSLLSSCVVLLLVPGRWRSLPADGPLFCFLVHPAPPVALVPTLFVVSELPEVKKVSGAAVTLSLSRDFLGNH